LYTNGSLNVVGDANVNGSFTVNGAEVMTTNTTTKHHEVITSWTWDSGASLYKATVKHNLNDRFVVVQFYNPATYESVLLDHCIYTDNNNIEVWSLTNINIGTIISK